MRSFAYWVVWEMSNDVEETDHIRMALKPSEDEHLTCHHAAHLRVKLGEVDNLDGYRLSIRDTDSRSNL